MDSKPTSVKKQIFSVSLLSICLVVLVSTAQGHSRICTHCCDEVYPGNGTPAYFLLKGEKGDEGKIGPPGPQGERGEKGVRGDMGIQGLVGPEGPKGDRGEAAPRNPKSAFSVARLHPLIGNESKATPVNFDKEFVNEGENFDLESGRFVVKYPGIYFFTYTVQSYLDKFIGIQLMRNNEPQVSRQVQKHYKLFVHKLNGRAGYQKSIHNIDNLNEHTTKSHRQRVGRESE